MPRRLSGDGEFDYFAALVQSQAGEMRMNLRAIGYVFRERHHNGFIFADRLHADLLTWAAVVIVIASAVLIANVALGIRHGWQVLRNDRVHPIGGGRVRVIRQ